MSFVKFSIRPIAPFLRELKRLRKKYASLASELEALALSLQTNPKQGTSLGRNCYKIRLSIASKGQGKSGGARVITCVLAVTTEIYLLSIYDKAEQDSLTDAELQALIDEIPTR